MRHNYNFTRRKLYLPEYGRHIHKMVDSLLLIEDRTERTRQAKAVIAVMGNLNPLLRDTADFTHKLWDHLFLMSDFQLDVDSPYPRPSREELQPTPRKLEYPQSYIRFKHYGKYVGKILKSLTECQDQHSVDATVDNIARYMRVKSYEYNLDHPNNEVIIKDIKSMTNNAIVVNEQALNNIRSDYKQSHTTHTQRQKGRQQQMKGKGRVAILQKNRQKTITRHTNTHNTTR